MRRGWRRGERASVGEGGVTSEVQDTPVLSEGELAQVLKRAREEGWRELALVPESQKWHMKDLSDRGWPAGRAFLVTSLSAEQVREVASIGSLNALDLMGCQLGAEGAQALASLTKLTSLNLYDNQVG